MPSATGSLDNVCSRMTLEAGAYITNPPLCSIYPDLSSLNGTAVSLHRQAEGIDLNS